MCGRFELVGAQRVFTRFQVANPDPALLTLEGVDPQDIRPTQRVLTLTADRVLSTARWGLMPSWAKGTKSVANLINVRREGISDKPKPSFRNPSGSNGRLSQPLPILNGSTDQMASGR